MFLLAPAVALLLATCAAATVVIPPSGNRDQLPLQRTSEIRPTARRKLHGRFLHITDFHPDPFYVEGSDPDQKCHRGKGSASHWGAETTGCDSPWSLVNATFQWIDENIKDKIDFVVWTGDSARHDNDEKIPRTPKQIYELNKLVADRMMKVFGKKRPDNDDDPSSDLNVPVVPTLGNNDIFPHNIMLPGPSKTTREYAEIWRHFVPEDQFHVFQKGAYFWSHVILGPNGKYGAHGDGGLAVLSLNTIYFFDSNKAVDGCKLHTEPGFQQMEWLDVQLEFMRDRGMKAILIGHVPPARTSTKQSWDDTCWKKYVRLAQKYRDVIVGHLYGHMNLDHFFLLDSQEAEKKKKPGGKKGKNDGKEKKGKKGDKKSSLKSVLSRKSDTCMNADFDPEEPPRLSIRSAETYLHSLRKAFAAVPDVTAMDGLDGETNAIGGKWGERYAVTLVGPSVVPNYFPTMRIIEYNTTGFTDSDVDGGNKVEPTKSSPSTGPAYSMQPFTWIGYTQYFANLTTANAAGRKTKVEYEVEYDTRTDRVYRLKDLTVRSYLELARRIVDARPSSTREADIDSKKKKKKKKKEKKTQRNKKRDRVWLTFVKRAFVSVVDDDDLNSYQVLGEEQC